MGKVILPQDLSDVIANLSNRVANLETGGKPMVGISGEASTSFSLDGTPSGIDLRSEVILATLSWTDTNITTNPKGQFYFTIYIDVDDSEDDRWPDGANVNEDNFSVEWWYPEHQLSNNTARSYGGVRVENFDSVSHTIYLHVRWLYTTGSNSSS